MFRGVRTISFDRRIKTDQLADLSFILFFADALVRRMFAGFFGSSALISMIGMLIPYVPLFIIFIRNPRKYIKLDFILLYVGVIVFFAITLLFHPEYEYHYLRSEYGIWDHVLKPYRGIYAYLFIRLIGEPDRILKDMRISGWIMMVYFVYRILKGEWFVVGARGITSNASYSVAFGYEVLPFALTFLFSALTEKNNTFFLAAVADIIMILVGGSRGPILFIGLFVVLYVFLYMSNTKKKRMIIPLVIIGAGLMYAFYEPILYFAMSLLEKYNLSSRFIRMLLAGTINADSGRTSIWKAALEMIRSNPFGYGAMGSRHVIANYVYAGYPHSIILEFLIDYGVFIGGFLLFAMFGYAFSILFSKDKKEWRDVFLPFFCSGCGMFISLTYWSRPEFWACLALGVCCSRDIKKKRKLTDLAKKQQCEAG